MCEHDSYLNENYFHRQSFLWLQQNKVKFPSTNQLIEMCWINWRFPIHYRFSNSETVLFVNCHIGFNQKLLYSLSEQHHQPYIPQNPSLKSLTILQLPTFLPWSAVALLGIELQSRQTSSRPSTSWWWRWRLASEFHHTKHFPSESGASKGENLICKSSCWPFIATFWW